jgi:hypothetical protein
MSRYRVVIQRVVSPDGKIIAEAKSVVITSSASDIESTTNQSVTVKTSSSNSCSSSSTSSSASTSKGNYGF